MHIVSNAAKQPIEIRMAKPADLHQHFRQGNRLKIIAPLVARRFRTALAMPNLEPPITTCSAAIAHSGEIMDATREHAGTFRVLLTFYLSDKLEPKELKHACREKIIVGVKYYPRGLTTNSDSGVENPADLWTPGTNAYKCLRILAVHNKVLLLHGADGFARDAVTIGKRSYAAGEELDAYDQEPHFVAYSLPRILGAHPDLSVSFEHLSTISGVEFMRKNGGGTLGCALTSHHLLVDRRDTHRKGLRPHSFWFPVPQPKEHRDELRKFAAEGHSFVWLGSDSAPHYLKNKESDCCAGGVMTAHAGIELYAEAFEKAGALDHLENFASINGPRFYGVAPSEETIKLVKKPWEVMAIFCSEEVVNDTTEEMPIRPFRYGEMIDWQLTT